MVTGTMSKGAFKRQKVSIIPKGKNNMNTAKKPGYNNRMGEVKACL
jgi:hypothetical protein